MDPILATVTAILSSATNSRTLLLSYLPGHHRGRRAAGNRLEKAAWPLLNRYQVVRTLAASWPPTARWEGRLIQRDLMPLLDEFFAAALDVRDNGDTHMNDEVLAFAEAMEALGNLVNPDPLHPWRKAARQVEWDRVWARATRALVRLRLHANHPHRGRRKIGALPPLQGRDSKTGGL